MTKSKYENVKTPKEAWAIASRLRKIRRIPELENIIVKEANTSYNYALKIIKGRWREAEPIILEQGTPKTLLYYAKNIIKGRWIDAEPKILESDYVYEYAKEVLKTRWPEGENALLSKKIEDFDEKFHFWDVDLMRYCKELVCNRWPEVEKILSTNPCALKEYAEEILQDKLPEDLHNIMIAYSIRGDDNRRGRIIQEYFDFVRKNDATIKKQLINRDLGNVTVKQFVNSL